MKKYFFIPAITLAIFSCSKDSLDCSYIREANAKVLTLPKAVYITESSAFVGGNITGNKTEVTEKGVYYSMESNFTIDESTPKVVSDSTTDISSFLLPIDGLNPNTVYYAKAYIKVKGSELYGDQISFETTEAGVITVPTILSDSITDIEPTAARVYGTVTAHGGSGVTQRGVCYSTSAIPTVDDSKVIDTGTGLGQFPVVLTNLVNLEYYNVRAYAINKKGIAYGEVKQFQARFIPKRPKLMIVSTNATMTTDYTTATVAIQITDNGGEDPSEFGIYYGTSPTNITTKFQETVNSIGPDGIVTVNISGLAMNTTYYLKAYAKNFSGTGYSTTILKFHSDILHSGLRYKVLPEMTVKVNGVDQSLAFLDRNLGATQVATDLKDAASYGWLFQFGRRADGHQVVNWAPAGTSGTFNLTKAPNTSAPANRVTADNTPYYNKNASNDWVNPAFTDPATQDNYWGVTATDPNISTGGTNNPCPPGFRIINAAEWTGIQILYATSAALFASPLKAPAAGYCKLDGNFNAVGTSTYFWASDLGTGVGVTTNKTAFFGGYAMFTTGKAVRGIEKASALSVRCVRIY